MELFDYEKRHLEQLRPLLAECTVLLKCNGDFPLQQAGELAAYGSGVRKTVKGGTGSGEVNSRFFVNVEQGLTDAGFTITTKGWLDAYDEIYAQTRKQFLAQLNAQAKAAHRNVVNFAMGRVMPEPEYELALDGAGDVAIYVLARTSGEGSDREPVGGDIKLSETEKRDILALNRRYSKFMLVINAGGVVDLSDIPEVENILILSQLGVETGSALADILLGRSNPSGKLSTTWSAWEDYATIGTFGAHDDTEYKEGIYVGYRYFDAVGKKALYPFGYGGSYTTFAIQTQQVSLCGSEVHLCAAVTNTGKYAGKEVVQAYVSAPTGTLDKPYQDLAGFAKTKLLEPGETATVTIVFDLKDLASYDEARSAFLLERGRYLVRVGNSSVNTVPVAAVELRREVIVTQTKPCCTNPKFTDWKPAERKTVEIPETIPVLQLEDGAISTFVVDDQGTYEIDEAVKGLTDEQIALSNVGAFKPKGGIMSIIGNASTLVAGAAGETTSRLKEFGFAPMVMADGPAGVRITPAFYRDRKGAHSVGQVNLPESFVEYLSAPLQWLLKLVSGSNKIPKNAKIEYQYCTALPIGTALAQSWNLELVEQCGSVVGEEMQRFGIPIWLAPAMNIHRSIRCGRNFEYFSEDPLLSGRMAAAITLGVQSHPGCATTVKHFAANNQETNRCGNCSWVSERALREIYLKGFGICIREAQPHALMTSYNLLNGRHTAERRDLCETILRREFGFAGIVMTDWVDSSGAMTSKEDIHPAVQAKFVAAAGGDLFMPGSNIDYQNILQGLRDGTLTREQLQINATRVYRMGKKLRGK